MGISAWLSSPVSTISARCVKGAASEPTASRPPAFTNIEPASNFRSLASSKLSEPSITTSCSGGGLTSSRMCWPAGTSTESPATGSRPLTQVAASDQRSTYRKSGASSRELTAARSSAAPTRTSTLGSATSCGRAPVWQVTWLPTATAPVHSTPSTSTRTAAPPRSSAKVSVSSVPPSVLPVRGDRPVRRGVLAEAYSKSPALACCPFTVSSTSQAAGSPLTCARRSPTKRSSATWQRDASAPR
mmetsp:Transcript_280/g.608  ORF Transcript_280/g.608 Transcript_280/m.608 type:complete len:244 (-) Transcript_280:2216-2947(-)